jgi:DNA-binding NarL/FixJ family response regulator
VRNAANTKFSSTEQFTKRESEVADLLKKGLSNKEICHSLNVCERTVEFHLANIFNKLVVRSRCEAIVRLLTEPVIMTETIKGVAADFPDHSQPIKGGGPAGPSISQ